MINGRVGLDFLGEGLIERIEFSCSSLSEDAIEIFKLIGMSETFGICPLASALRSCSLIFLEALSKVTAEINVGFWYSSSYEHKIIN